MSGVPFWFAGATCNILGWVAFFNGYSALNWALNGLSLIFLFVAWRLEF